MPTYSSRAAWTGTSVIEYPVIECIDGKITEITTRSKSSAIDVEFEDALILPGFINAHSHLEYSFLKERLPSGCSFTSWVRQLIILRAQASADVIVGHVQSAIESCIRSGTTTLLDIVTSGIAIPRLAQSGLRAWTFLEVIQPDAQKAIQTMEQAVERLAEDEDFPLLSCGLSPHAPYSLSREIAKSLSQMAKSENFPLAIHLAESPEERQMLEKGSGSLHDMFRDAGLLPDHWKAPGVGPVQWAAEAGLLGNSTFAIHCNYLNTEDVEFLRETESTVVYCPRSHKFFNHSTHPIERLLQAGINVCIGTDSLASNSSLDLLEELRLFHSLHPDISAVKLFQMIGSNVAGPLGLDGRLGVIAPGAMADFTVLAPCPKVTDAEALLLAVLEDSSVHPAAVVVNESLL